MSRPVPVRGVIEGFYGPVWSHDARLGVIDFVGARGMNAYVYAPKSDPKHRDEWREPYDRAETATFAQLATRCGDAGVRLGFAISPGLDIAYEATRDRAALLAKLLPMLEVGIDWIVLALDDIPNRPGLATDQAALTTWLAEELRVRSVGTRCSLVPTEYVGTRPSAYLGDAFRPARRPTSTCSGPVRPCAHRRSRPRTPTPGVTRSAGDRCCCGTTTRSTTR